MKITKASFITSATGNNNFAERGLPQIPTIGKSNVGKSSLINCLANQKKLARTSQKPGHTRLINIYSFNDTFHLVDLPGYGFAKASVDERRTWEGMMNDYLENSELIVHFLQLVDIRHDPTEHDKVMMNWIKEAALPYTVVATKADKLSKSQTIRSISQISKALDVEKEDIVAFSSVNRQGREELLNRFEKALKG